MHARLAAITSLALALSTPSGSAWAQRACVVTDPTGTPLNVRSGPNGPILGALHNGAIVRVAETAVDLRDSAWFFFVPDEAGKAGWAFREFVSCY